MKKSWKNRSVLRVFRSCVEAAKSNNLIGWQTKLLIFMLVGLISLSSNGQIHSYETTYPATEILSNDDFNKIEYDRCTGTLNIAMESTKSGTNGTWPIVSAFVYIKIGTTWRMITSIRSASSTCNGTHAAACTGSIDPNHWLGTKDVTTQAWSPTFFSNAATNVFGTTVDVAGDLRIAYANGAYGNHSWATYVDNNICSQYNANLDVVSNTQPMDLVPWQDAPRIKTDHSSKIPQNMEKIGFYPTDGSEWGIQFGVTNIPHEAMVGDVINVRIYKHTRSICCPTSTAIGNNGYQVLELATSVNAVDAPFGLSASDDECGQVRLNWQNPTQSWSSSLNCTNTQTYQNVIFRDGVKLAVLAGNTTSYVDNSVGLQQRQEYTYTVAKTLWNRNSKTYRSSGVSNVAIGNMKMPPAQPSPFAATDDKCDTKVELTWSQPTGEAADEYIIRRYLGGVLNSTFSGITGTTKAYTDNTVTRGVNYEYRITAENNCNYASDIGVEFGFSPADPAKATNITITPDLVNNDFLIEWDDNANNETKYQVQRQDDQGNAVFFDANANDTTLLDDAPGTCKGYTYKVKVFNDCVQSGYLSDTSASDTLPPPNLSSTFDGTNFLTASKGYFGNRVELSFNNNNNDVLDFIKVYRKVVGASGDSTQIGSVPPGNGLFIDQTSSAGVFYEYTLVGETTCVGAVLSSNTTQDIGYRAPTGVINGHIDYTGGIAVKDVKVVAEATTGTPARSLELLTGPQGVLIPNSASLAPGTGLTLEAWIRPTSLAANFNIFQRNNMYHLSYVQATNSIRFVIYSGGVARFVDVPSTLVAGSYTHVAGVFDGTTLKIFINGVEAGSLGFVGALDAVAIDVFLGNGLIGNMDEARIWNVAKDSLSMARDFSRFLIGNELGLKCYLPFDEGALGNAYDQSFYGAIYNENHGTISAGANWSTTIPTANQLSFVGYSNASGDYSVNIKYFGASQSFTVTPQYLTHQFDPSNQTLTLGDGAATANNVDFEDISSFLVTGTLFYENTTCPVEGATLKVDGTIVVASGNPVKSLADGTFSIQVPIGEHFVTIEKHAHTMSSGRFPPTGTFDFQAPENINFLDSTKVKIVGRVAGGLREAQKLPGLGRGNNNIGVTRVILASTAGGGCIRDTAFTDTSGEYVMYVPPLQYTPEITVLSNLTISFPVNNLDYTNVPPLVETYDTLGYDTLASQYFVDSIKYHHLLDYIYRVDPEIAVLDYENPNLTFNGNKTYEYTHPNGTSQSIDLTQPTSPINWALFDARGKNDSAICLIRVFEDYTNYDDLSRDSVPTTDGELVFINELSKIGVHSVKMKDVNTLDSLKFLRYIFKLGKPNFTENTSIPELSFVRKMEIRLIKTDGTAVPWLPYNFKGVKSPLFAAADDGIFRGYIMGVSSNGNQFATAGPQIPEYILRDPPGSGSFSSREVGSTKSTENNWSWNSGGSVSSTDKLFIGTKFTTGIGVAVETDAKNNVSAGFTTTASGGNSGSESITTTNTQTWETNSNNFLPGRGSDLYIGKSKNVEFGVSETMHLVPDSMCTKVECIGAGFTGYSFAKQYGLSIVPGGYGTQFMINESDVKETIIPTLVNLRNVMMQTDSRYTSHIPITDDNYALNNDDSRVDASLPQLTGDGRISYMLQLRDSIGVDTLFNLLGVVVATENIKVNSKAQGAEWKILDAMKNPDFSILSGNSYTFTAATLQDSLTGDSVRWINNQIRQWEDAIMLNEWEKVNVNNAALREDLKKSELTRHYEKNLPTLIAYNLLVGTSGAATAATAITSAVPVPGVGLLGAASFAVGSGTGIGAAELFAEFTRYELDKKRIEDKYDQTGVNHTFSAGNTFTSSMTHESASSYTRSVEYGMSATLGLEIEGKINNTGIGMEKSVSVDFSSGRDWSETTSTTSTISYTLTDEDQQDLYSVDVYPSLLGWGPIFRTRAGGRTSCPHEGEQLTEYYMDNPANAGTNPTYPNFILADKTQQIEKVEISAAPTLLTNVPSDAAAAFNLTLANLSETNDDVLYRVRLDPASNPFGAIVKIDGIAPTQDVFVLGSSALNKVITIEKGAGPVYDYDSLRVVFQSICQYAPGDETDDFPNIADTAYISAHFLPTCTDVSFILPENFWVLNNSFNDTMPIAIKDYDINFFDFNQIDLQYKPSASATWIGLENFIKDTTGMNDTTLLIIPTVSPFTTWEWVTDQLVDGDYDLRLVSKCTLADKTSLTHTGVMDRIDPHPFGNPSPADGILSPNDEIMIQFNEPVDLGALTQLNFDVRGVINGEDIRHDASLFFDGVNNYVRMVSGLNLNSTSTVEMWVQRNNNSAAEIFFSQGINAAQSYSLGFTAGNNLTLNLAGQTFNSTGTIADSAWHHITCVYDKPNNTVEFYIDGALSGTNNTFVTNYTETGDVYIGKSTHSAATFTGNIHQLRVWNRARTTSEVFAALNITMSGQEFGVVGVWPMDEAIGGWVEDVSRQRNGEIFGATWAINPSGRAMVFNGTEYLQHNTGRVSFTDEMDFTIEFWFKGDPQADSACLFSNGKGKDFSTWAIYTDATGHLFVQNNDKTFQIDNTDYMDGSWHHLAVVMNRITNMVAYVDGTQAGSTQSTTFGEFGSIRAWVGARGYHTGVGVIYNQDQHFDGMIDEVRVWNLARKQEQIERDRVNRMKGDEFGLKLYFPFEEYQEVLGVPVLTPVTTNIVNDSTSVIASGAVVYEGTDIPPIKLPRPIKNIPLTYSVNDDKIIITPGYVPALIENVTLDVTVQGVLDLHGNVMQSPKTWIAYVDRNQVFWQDLRRDISLKLGEPYQFTTNIVNSGGATKAFDISNLPEWLSVDISSGNIAPNSTMAVTFTVTPGTNIGDYEQDVYLTTDFGFNEALFVTLKIRKDPPNLDLDPADYQYSMNIVGQVSVDAIISTDDEDILIAMVGSEVRGVANLEYYEDYDAYLVFLDVYSNVVAGENLTFHVWDASAGKLHVEVVPSLVFAQNTLTGTPNTPQLFAAVNTISEPIALNAGWNWVSFPLNSVKHSNINTLMQEVTSTHGDLLKSKTAFDQYNTSIGWVGTVSSAGGVNNVESYKIYSALADTIDYTGAKVDPDTITISIDSGWNWMGYVAVKNQTVDAALGNFNPSHGDLLKSQLSFAIYDSILGWVGNLDFMVPENGYMYNASQAGSFVYPRSGMFNKSTEMEDEQKALVNQYALNPAKYKYNMNAVINLMLCADEQAGNDLELFAYYGGTLRGVAKGEDGKFFMTLYGNAPGDVMRFVAVDEFGRRFEFETSMLFTPNTLSGTVAQPSLLKSNRLIVENCEAQVNGVKSTVEVSSDVSIHPTIFKERFTVTLKLDKSQPISLNLYDITGKLITELVSDVYAIDGWSQTIDVKRFNLTNGVYIVKTSLDDGTTIVNKIVKVKN